MLHDSFVGSAGLVAAKSEHPGVDVIYNLGDVLRIENKAIVFDVFLLVEIGIVDEVPA